MYKRMSYEMKLTIHIGIIVVYLLGRKKVGRYICYCVIK